LETPQPIEGAARFSFPGADWLLDRQAADAEKSAYPSAV